MTCMVVDLLWKGRGWWQWGWWRCSGRRNSFFRSNDDECDDSGNEFSLLLYSIPLFQSRWDNCLLQSCSLLVQKDVAIWGVLSNIRTRYILCFCVTRMSDSSTELGTSNGTSDVTELAMVWSIWRYNTRDIWWYIIWCKTWTFGWVDWSDLAVVLWSVNWSCYCCVVLRCGASR